ncbi:unnamed protein product [Polarella glacialis]|uniref:Uncharacterized protein n=1 Tax=Polarella glacialis TaxID=89957 RepID=A0A813EYS4_POLGL|nr:unnamed protein product [Polarella glacialis]
MYSATIPVRFKQLYFWPGVGRGTQDPQCARLLFVVCCFFVRASFWQTTAHSGTQSLVCCCGMGRGPELTFPVLAWCESVLQLGALYFLALLWFSTGGCASCCPAFVAQLVEPHLLI